MTPVEFVDSIRGFSALNFAEQIKRFCWYLSFHQRKTTLTGSDVGRCFDAARCPKPSSIPPFLASLASQKPPFLLRGNGCYSLSRHAHEQFDSILGQRESTIAVHQMLRSLPALLSVDYEKVYLEEALTCFKHGAFRAAVVMTWNLAYDHLCNVILRSTLPAFNAQLPKSFPKADIASVTVRDHFTELKESQVLQVARSANIISGSVHKVLKEKLDRRNIAAHPSGVAVSQLTAEEFITDLVQNVVLKL